MRTTWSFALVTVAFSIWGADASAIPAFARKYDTPCATCHAVYPKLNPFGRAFKENGLRMPDESTTWAETLRSFPVSLRSNLTFDLLGPDTSRFTYGLFKPIFAASLSNVVTLWIDRNLFAVDLPGQQKVQDLGTDNGWLQVDDVLRAARPDLLNVKVGKFELDLPFTQTRTYNRFPYEPYQLTTGNEGFTLSGSERGIEFSGSPGKEVRYSVAFVDGKNPQSVLDADDFDGDLYFRLSKTFDRTHRVGFFLYRGQNTLRDNIGNPYTNNITRLGGDADLLGARGKANLYGLYLWGRNSNPTGPSVVTTPLDLDGGFVQFDGHAAEWITFIGRFSTLNADAAPGVATRFNNVAFGAQSWLYERLKIAYEFRFQLDKNGMKRIDWGTLSFDLVL